MRTEKRTYGWEKMRGYGRMTDRQNRKRTGMAVLAGIYCLMLLMPVQARAEEENTLFYMAGCLIQKRLLWN